MKKLEGNESVSPNYKCNDRAMQKRNQNLTTSYHENPSKFAYTVRKGDIFWVESDDKDIVGCEQAKTRPVAVIQNNFGNAEGKTFIGAKITASERDKSPLPTNVYINSDSGNGLTKDSIIMLNQITTFDKSRIIDKMGSVNLEQLNLINRGLLISFGIDVLYL